MYDIYGPEHKSFEKPKEVKKIITDVGTNLVRRI